MDNFKRNLQYARMETRRYGLESLCLGGIHYRMYADSPEDRWDMTKIGAWGGWEPGSQMMEWYIPSDPREAGWERLSMMDYYPDPNRRVFVWK